MKFLGFFATLLLIVLGTNAQAPVTTMVFDQVVWDFGTIREQDGVVTHSFSYKNTGAKPLIITDVRTSCGCTSTGYSRAPLMPGKSAILTIKFDPTNQVGRVEKSILVRANVADGSVGLKIRGTVTPRPRTVEDDYPVELTDGVRVTDVVVQAGNVANTRETVQTLGFLNKSSKPAEIFVSNIDRLPSWLIVSPRKLTVAPGQKGSLTITLKPEANLWGQRTAPLAITVNGRIQFSDIVVRAMFIEDFALRAQGSPPPRVRIDGIFYHFSTVKRGEVLRRSFKLSNAGAAELIVRALDCGDGIRADISAMRVQPGGEVQLDLMLDSNTKGSKNGLVRVITNDPLRPVLELRLLANVVE